MNEPLALCAAQKFQLLEMLYMRKPNGQRVRPGTKAVLYLLADCRAALHWSNARIAEHIGYSLRTVARAMVELREAGILTSFRKTRRSTAQKFLDVTAAVRLVAVVREKAKRNSAIALGFVRRGLEVPRRALADLWVRDVSPKVVTSAPKIVAHEVASDDRNALEAALERLHQGIRSRT